MNCCVCGRFEVVSDGLEYSAEDRNLGEICLTVFLCETENSSTDGEHSSIQGATRRRKVLYVNQDPPFRYQMSLNLKNVARTVPIYRRCDMNICAKYSCRLMKYFCSSHKCYYGACRKCLRITRVGSIYSLVDGIFMPSFAAVHRKDVRRCHSSGNVPSQATSVQESINTLWRPSPVQFLQK